MRILKNWGFSEYLIQVPSQHLNIERSGTDGVADYTDIVQVALIQTVLGTSHPLASVDQENVSALDRLRMRDSIEEIHISGGIIEVEEIKAALL